MVHDILKNPINKGKKKLGEEYYDVPAIVSEEYWEKVIANLKENKKKVGKKVQYNYLLKGIIFCSHCGRQILCSTVPLRIYRFYTYILHRHSSNCYNYLIR